MERWVRQHPYVVEKEKMHEKLGSMQETIRKHKTSQENTMRRVSEAEAELKMAQAENARLGEAVNGHARQAMLHLEAATKAEALARENGEAARQSGEAAKQSADACTFLKEQCRVLEERMSEERTRMEQALAGALDDRRRLEQANAARAKAHGQVQAQHAAAARAALEHRKRLEDDCARMQGQLASSSEDRRRLEEQVGSLTARVEALQVESKSERASADVTAKGAEFTLLQEVRRMEVRTPSASGVEVLWWLWATQRCCSLLCWTPRRLTTPHHALSSRHAIPSCACTGARGDGRGARLVL